MPLRALHRGLLSDDDAADAGRRSSSPGSIRPPARLREPVVRSRSRVAARKAGGQLVAYGHIPTQAILAALDITAPGQERD